MLNLPDTIGPDYKAQVSSRSFCCQQERRATEPENTNSFAQESDAIAAKESSLVEEGRHQATEANCTPIQHATAVVHHDDDDVKQKKKKKRTRWLLLYLALLIILILVVALVWMSLHRQSQPPPPQQSGSNNNDRNNNNNNNRNDKGKS